MLVFWHDCHKHSLVTAPLHGLDRDNWKKKKGTAETMKTIFPPTFTVQALFHIVSWPHLVTSISESDLNHYYFQLLWDDKANVSYAWMGEKNYFIRFFFQELYISVSKRREKRKWNISQTVFLWYISDFDIQKEWVSVWLHGTITRKTFHSYLR